MGNKKISVSPEPLNLTFNSICSPILFPFEGIFERKKPLKPIMRKGFSVFAETLSK